MSNEKPCKEKAREKLTPDEWKATAQGRKKSSIRSVRVHNQKQKTRAVKTKLSEMLQRGQWAKQVHYTTEDNDGGCHRKGEKIKTNATPDMA